MRTIFAMTLLVLALAFAGCEPAGNNTGNAGSGGNGGATEPGTPTEPTDPTNPTEPGTDPTDPGTDPATGNWNLSTWQTWQQTNGNIPGVTDIPAFVDWANSNYPTGIPYAVVTSFEVEEFPGNWGTFHIWAMTFTDLWSSFGPEPPAGNAAGNPLDQIETVNDDADRSLEDAGLSEVQ